MKEKLTCYIIDDAPLAQDLLREYVSKVPFLELIGTFMSPLEANSQIEIDKPNILFLDINMPDLNGLSFIPMLNPKPTIILTTAHDQYALKAFELEVKDYLVKPFAFERFYKSVLSVYQAHTNPSIPVQKDPKLEVHSGTECIFLKVGYRNQKLMLNDIIYIEGMKDYLRIHTTKEKIMTLMSLTNLSKLLPTKNFVRVHRSFIIAIDKIDHIERNRIKIMNQYIPIGKTYSESFFEKLKGFS